MGQTGPGIGRGFGEEFLMCIGSSAQGGASGVILMHADSREGWTCGEVRLK